ncbi:DUF4249 domain-containing protein [Panacibacter sp. DH6]|uniref:DUF4249 domain-containing protein n=1 Tax=Panacibacter microcysteis TaxID=2793269 RepID=A0A931E642_9BACT|nr:DUF4249 domain-containing protein [Panacibacter microcysteis]MBG9377748.1 DUF4249 domain-containing protein [Panacibacter microcysteis]
MRPARLILFVLFAGILFCACKEVYEPNLQSPQTGYLVVDGFINSASGGTSTITLTRTTKLVDTVSVLYEHGASVVIEGENGESYYLTPGINGTYTSDPLTLNTAVNYRVHINTADGKEYTSAYTPVKATPVIDSISWEQTGEGVTTHINTHDATGNVKYYRWTYAETWQIRSAYYSTLKYTVDPLTSLNVGVEYRNAGLPDLTIWDCWQSYTAKNIMLGTTEKLSSDIIYLPLTHIEPESIKLSVLYSVELKQYALSKGAYNFYEQLRKNTEQLGSIFDAQPSELIGNIQCITDPGEIVIGYVDVTTESTKRIFISNRDVDKWGYSQGCSNIKIDNNADSIAKYGNGLIPTVPNQLGPFNSIIDFYAADPYCVDCTLRGTNQRPSFWP